MGRFSTGDYPTAAELNALLQICPLNGGGAAWKDLTTDVGPSTGLDGIVMTDDVDCDVYTAVIIEFSGFVTANGTFQVIGYESTDGGTSWTALGAFADFSAAEHNMQSHRIRRTGLSGDRRWKMRLEGAGGGAILGTASPAHLAIYAAATPVV